MHLGTSEDAPAVHNAARRRRVVIDATAGALAGLISRFIVSPLDVIKIRFQVQLEPISDTARSIQRASKYKGLTHAFTTIFKEEGIPVSASPACTIASAYDYPAHTD